MTNYEFIKNGTKEDLIDELATAMNWARQLPEKYWRIITTNKTTFKNFIREKLDEQY